MAPIVGEADGPTWDDYVNPGPVIGSVVGSALLFVLLGTLVGCFTRQRRKRQIELAPNPYLREGGGWQSPQFPTTFSDTYSHRGGAGGSNLSQHYSQPQYGIDPISRRFPSATARPPPTVSSSTHYGPDQIAETISTRSSEAGSNREPPGHRLYIPGTGYLRADHSDPYHHVRASPFCHRVGQHANADICTGLAYVTSCSLIMFTYL